MLTVHFLFFIKRIKEEKTFCSINNFKKLSEFADPTSFKIIENWVRSKYIKITWRFIDFYKIPNLISQTEEKRID